MLASSDTPAQMPDNDWPGEGGAMESGSGMAGVITSPGPSVTSEWRRGWAVVLSASLGFSFFSVMLSGAGIFMGPLGKEFGWSKTLLSGGIAIATWITALLSPPFGMLVDRYGSRRVAIPGIVLTTASCAAFGLVNGAAWQWLTLWFIFGVTASAIKSTVWTAAVLGVFDKAKGLALGLTLAGTAVAQLLVPNIGHYLITHGGWRLAYVWLALGWGGLTLLVCLLAFDDHQSIAARASVRVDPAADAARRAALPGLSIPQAWRDWALWRVAISNFVVMVLTMGLGVHMVEILREAGVTPGRAAFLSSLGGLAGIIGKLATGALLDRYKPNWIGGVTLGAASLAFLLLLNGIRSPLAIFIALMINGYAAGTKTQITAYLTSAYGGMKNFGAIYGVMAALMAAASGLGPLTAGLIADSAGNYGPFLILGAIGCALGGVLIVSMPAYPGWAVAQTQSRDESRADPA